MYDYGARMYDPTLGRWFVNDKLADDEMQIDKSPYAYSWNSPVSLNDPDGNCPWCIGALVGAVVDIAVQAVEISLDDSKTSKDFSWKSVGISAAAGTVGVGLASKLTKVSKIIKVGIELSSDAASSAATQYVKEGKVSGTDVLIDVAAGLAVRKSIGKALDSKFLKSGKGKNLTSKVNEQVNASNGESNTISKAKANIQGAKDKLTTEQAASGAGAATAASSAISTTISEAKKLKDKKDL